MDIDGVEHEDNQIVDEDELFAPLEAIAPLSPIGPLEIGDNLGQDFPQQDGGGSDEPNQDKTKKKDKGDGKDPKPRKPGAYMNIDRLGGPRGVKLLPQHFSKVKFRGKGHEKKDLDKLLGIYEQWAHNMFPKSQFIDVVDRIEGFKPGNVRQLVHNCKQDGIIAGDDEFEDDGVEDTNQSNNNNNKGRQEGNIEKEKNTLIGNILDDDFDEIDLDDFIANEI
eukprot:gene12667-13967_t